MSSHQTCEFIIYERVGNQITVKMWLNQPMRIAIEAICQKLNISPSIINKRFFFVLQNKKTVIRDNDTPQSLGICQNDKIKVIFPRLKRKMEKSQI